MKTHSLLVISGLALIATLLMSAPNSAQSPAALEQLALHAGHHGPFCGDDPCDAVARGAVAFLDGRLHGLDGNGRSCADCHMPSDHFQLSPADAEARFQALQLLRQRHPDADDPLFRPIDADDFRTNGENAGDYSNLRQNGLIRISFALPPNMRLIDPATNLPSSETFVDVWRSVPTVLNVALTGPDNSLNAWPRGPNFFGGYQLDARVGTLQEQALGALTNHAQIQGAASERLLDDLSSFQRVLFSSNGVRALSDAVAAGTTPLPDPDPPLDALEEQGKVVFQRACAQCHGGPGQSTAQGAVLRYTEIHSSCPRPVDTVTPPRWAFARCPAQLARNERTYEITVAGGTTVRRTSSDPGRALLTGFVGGPAARDDWNKLDPTGLHGISERAPYFHNNSAATLEDVVDHYVQFFKRVQANAPPGGLPPPVATTDGVHFDRRPAPEEREALLAYLRKL
jgi:cytochrome c peroxidase